MTIETIQASYAKNGYAIVKGLFSPDEVAFYRDYYMQLRAKGKYPGDFDGVDITSNDPLKRYPRLIHMHHWDDVSLRWLLDRRITDILTSLLGNEPYALQTMVYFKPPKARGQALHQDQYYLRATPGTCMAAWLALDPCDEANGCMRIVPGSQDWPILCTEKANTKESFTDVTVPIPEGQEIRPIIMDAGDVLFFGGSLVHGSYPNTTEDRFRRALIGHYVSGEAEQVSRFSTRVWKLDGTVVDLVGNEEGGLCGVWVDEDGQQVIELVGTAAAPDRGVE